MAEVRAPATHAGARVDRALRYARVAPGEVRDLLEPRRPAAPRAPRGSEIPRGRVGRGDGRGPREASHASRAPARPAPAAPAAAAPSPASSLSSITLPIGEAELRRAIDSAALGGTISEAQTLARSRFGELRIAAGTRVEIALSGSRLDISTDPGLTLDLHYGPNVTIRRIQYDLNTGRFEVDAEGPGPDFLYREAATWFANRTLRPLLPVELQTPGYDPRTDPELIARFQRTVTSVLTGQPGPAGVTFSNPTARASIRLARELRVDLPEGNVLIVPRGTPFSFDASFEGPIEAPVLRELTVRSSGRGVVLRQSEGLFSSIAGLEIRGVTVRPGGRLAVDYTPLPETALNGGESLLRLLGGAIGVASGDPRGLELLNAPPPNHRLPELRREIDGRIHGEAEPALLRLIRDNDMVVPGFSLTRLMGVPAASP